MSVFMFSGVDFSKVYDIQLYLLLFFRVVDFDKAYDIQLYLFLFSRVVDFDKAYDIQLRLFLCFQGLTSTMRVLFSYLCFYVFRG